jgi:hypothetical protein
LNKAFCHQQCFVVFMVTRPSKHLAWMPINLSVPLKLTIKYF